MTEIRHQRKGAKAPARQKFIVGEQASKNIEQVLNEYQTNLLGLSENEALDRLVVEGENEVAHEKAPPAWKQLLTSFKNPFIFVLMILAIVSFFTDYVIPERQGEETDLTGVIIIVTMVVLSGLLRFWQEYRTNKAAEALKSLVRTTATVFRRDDRTGRSIRKEVPIKCLVPGDIVLLSAGDMVPADLKLVESRDLFISQAILTGESIPVEKYDTLANVSAKSLEPASPTENELLEISNICLMGTNVTSGTARGIVVATGSKTYLGSLAKSIVGTRAQTAFDRGVNSVSWLLIRFMLVMVPIVLLINGFTKGDWFEATLFSLAVAVGLTPEMLPMIVSSNLAKGAIAMSKHKVIVKRLNAIQNFGAMDVLCTDKTGTLTQDRIILEHYLDSNGQKDSRILQLAWLNSFHQSGAKNMMDQAIIRRGRGNDKVEQLKAYQKIDELPFDFIRRKLSVTVKTPEGDALLICKGAAEEMLAVCHSYQHDGHTTLLDAQAKARIAELVSDYNKQGFRVLLLATRSLNDAEALLPLSAQAEQQLELQGILTFLDPAKESAISAIAALRENGVMVKVLTGDNAVITEKICHDVGLNIDEIMTGLEVEAMNDEELKTKVGGRSEFCVTLI